MPAKYEIKTGKNGKLHFNLLAANGEVVLTSQMYASRPGVVKAIASIQANSCDEARFEQLEGKKGKSYFVLKALNGRVIGTSQMYATPAACKKGIKSVIKCGKATAVAEV